MELLYLGLFVLVIYLLVRLTAAAMSGLAGSRHRAYRQLAARYAGRYENRGLVDPPTVSFPYGGSSIRVGLAPTVAGQANPARTRVVARFAQGLPFRMELYPLGRPSPPQPPRGTRPVRTGMPDFDRAYYVHANDPDMATELLRADAVRLAIDDLRSMAPPSGMLVSINPERMLVQVDRNLGIAAPQLDSAVRDALALHDNLRSIVTGRLSVGIDIVEVGAARPGEAGGPPMCEVCGEAISGLHVLCASCRTPCHRDCWTFVGGCSIFGCTSKQCVSA